MSKDENIRYGPEFDPDSARSLIRNSLLVSNFTRVACQIGGTQGQFDGVSSNNVIPGLNRDELRGAQKIMTLMYVAQKIEPVLRLYQQRQVLERADGFHSILETESYLERAHIELDDEILNFISPGFTMDMWRDMRTLYEEGYSEVSQSAIRNRNDLSIG